MQPQSQGLTGSCLVCPATDDALEIGRVVGGCGGRVEWGYGQQQSRQDDSVGGVVWAGVRVDAGGGVVAGAGV